MNYWENMQDKKNLIYYIHGIDKNNNQKNAGSKAVADVYSILEKRGFIKIDPFFSNKNVISFLLEYIIMTIKIGKLKMNSIIISNYPLRFNLGRVYKWYLLNPINRRKKKIFIVHDIEELQFGLTSADKYFYRRCKIDKNIFLIVHTNKMKDFLLLKGIDDERIIILGIFDYISSSIYIDRGYFGNEIIIAGNLSIEKNGFLTKAHNCKNLRFNLYGVGIDEKLLQNDNFDYYGSFAPDELIENLNGSYGLVWDSEDLKGGVGKKAIYQMYNSPHKLSLYLAAGIPVIVWSGAAVSSFVRANHLGLIVDSLEDLDKEVLNITIEKYNCIKLNVLKYGDLIRKGHFLDDALIKTLNKIDSIDSI